MASPPLLVRRRARLRGLEERARTAEAEVAQLREEARGLRLAQEQAHGINRQLIADDLHNLRMAVSFLTTRLQDQGNCLSRRPGP
jgi:hypothetical protein